MKQFTYFGKLQSQTQFQIINIYSPADMPEVTLMVAKFFNFEKKVTHFFTCKYSSQSLFLVQFLASYIHLNLIFFSYGKCIEFIFQMSIYLMGKKVFTLPSREKGSLRENVFCKWHLKQSYKSKYIFQLKFFLKYIVLNLTC